MSWSWTFISLRRRLLLGKRTLLRRFILKSVDWIWIIIWLWSLTRWWGVGCSIILILWIIRLRIFVLSTILISLVVYLLLTIPRVDLLRLTLLVWSLIFLIFFLLLFLFEIWIWFFFFLLLCIFFLFLIIFFFLFFCLLFLFFLSFLHLLISFFHHWFNISFLKLIYEIIWIKLILHTPRRHLRLSKIFLKLSRSFLILIDFTLILIKLWLCKLWILWWFRRFLIARILHIRIILNFILRYSKRCGSNLLSYSIF